MVVDEPAHSSDPRRTPEVNVDDFATAKSLVEEALKKIGVDPDAVRGKDAPDVASWAVKRGSAQVLVSLARREPNKQVFLRVVSPVVTLPEPGKREPLYVRCLELNANGLGNCAFGIVGERIVALSERPTEGLDQNEVEQIVRQVAAVADTYDDRLSQEFGGKRASDK
jgi:hypothetical protein